MAGQEIIWEQMPVSGGRRAEVIFFSFRAQGQLRILSSLGTSSPPLLICILLPTPALISKSPAPSEDNME